MADASHSSQTRKVFISYKREERDLALFVRQKLGALEVQFFMDLELTPDGDYGSRLDQYLADTSAVLVLWTNLSKGSEFVRSEAQKGFNRGVLVAARFDNVAVDDLSVPFNRFHTSDLSDWRSTGASAKHPEWQNVLEALGRKLGRPGLPQLAATLESGTDIGKKAFLRVHPDDPGAVTIAAQLEALERQDFEKRLSAARTRMARREREVEKRLNATREAFELSLQDLRAGRDYMPPDPVNALNDNVAKLREQVEIGEGALADLRTQLEQTVHDKDEALERLSQRAPETPPGERQQRKLWVALATLLGVIAGAVSAWSYTRTQVSDPVELSARAQALATREAENTKANEDLTRRQTSLDVREKQVNATKQTLDAREAETARAKAEIDRRESTLGKRETDLGAAQRQVTAREDEIRRRSEVVVSAEQAVASKNATLADREREVTRREEDLKRSSDERTRRAEEQMRMLQAQLTQSQSREAGLDGRVKSTERERDALSGQLAQKLKDVAEKDNQLQSAGATITALNSRANQLEEQLAKLKAGPEVPHVDPANPPSSASPRKLQPAPLLAASKFVTECDNMTAYRYDPDRPKSSSWKDQEIDIPAGALSVCQKALQGSTDSKVVRRRIIAQIGRSLMAESKRSTNNETKRTAAEQALSQWNQATALESGQAFVALAAYFLIEQHDNRRAWENYERAAELNNPVGQTHAARFLLFPEKFKDEKLQDVAPRDEARGRKYLEAARPAGYPRTLYNIGEAMREGRGWPKDPDGGRELIGEAYCMGDREAAGFYLRTKKHERPKCDPSSVQSRGANL